MEKKNSEVSSISLKLHKEDIVVVLSSEDKKKIQKIDLNMDHEISLKETEYFDIFDQESLIVSKLKIEKKDDFGMLELSDEAKEELDREENELKMIEKLELSIKTSNNTYLQERKMRIINQASINRETETIQNHNMNKIMKTDIIN